MLLVILAYTIINVLFGVGVDSILSAPRYVTDYSSRLKNNEAYDYVVIGAGTAGAVVANRLSDRGFSVLLVEAGGYPTTLTRIPGLSLSLLMSSLDWQYKSESNNISCLSSQDRQCRISAGLVIGGSNTICHMIYIRGHPSGYDNWNITGWSWEEILPYFLRYQGFQELHKLPASSEPYHNTTGPLKMNFFTDPENAWRQRLVEGFQSLDVPFNPDVNAESHTGVTITVGYVMDGERTTIARAYLDRDSTPSNLKLALHTTATKIIINDDGVAQGVRIKTKGLLFPKELNIYAKREVIVSASYIGTPKLLLLSGIGPAADLQNLGITPRADLPVGKEFADHCLPLIVIKVDRGFGINFPNPLPLLPYGPTFIQWTATKSGPLAANGISDVNTLLNTDCYDFENHKLTNDGSKCDIPDFQFIHAYFDRNLASAAKPIIQRGYGLDDYTFAQVSKANVNHAFILMSPVLLNGKSRGTVSLRSSDPSQPPVVNPNYLSHEDDVDKMIKAIKIVEDLVKTPSFEAHNASILYLDWDDCPKPLNDEPASDEYWSCYARHMTVSALHGAGTAALGQVVDEQLRVKGIENLRVIDSSVMPLPPHGNSGPAVIAIGEKGAAIILEE